MTRSQNLAPSLRPAVDADCSMNTQSCFDRAKVCFRYVSTCVIECRACKGVGYARQKCLVSRVREKMILSLFSRVTKKSKHLIRFGDAVLQPMVDDWLEILKRLIACC